MGKRAQWILLSVGLLAVAGFGWAKLRRGHEPVARFTMGDGTELRLEYVTYGTHHVIPGASRFVTWLSAKAYLLPLSRMSIRVPNYTSEYSRDTDAPCPMLWFTQRNPRTREFQSFPGLSYISSAEPYPDETVSAGGEPPLPNASCEVPCYDRRKPSFRVRLHTSGQTFDIDVPNPVAGATFPEWRPEPLPQTRRAGKYDVVLHSLTFTRLDGSLRVVPKFEVFEAGQPFGFWECRCILSDATGNETRDWKSTDIPPLTEHAWKVRWTLLRVSGSDVAPETVEFIVTPPKLPAER